MKDSYPMNLLWIDIHQAIAEAAGKLANAIGRPDVGSSLWYPPGIELTPEENKALSELALSNAARSGLSKLAASACGVPVFQILALFDGVAHPVAAVEEFWPGVELSVAGEEDRVMLHDEFLESFWSYVNANQSSTPS